MTRLGNIIKLNGYFKSQTLQTTDHVAQKHKAIFYPFALEREARRP